MVDASTEATVRNLRSVEPWLQYDSIVVGQGANAIDNGWFNDFQAFGRADRIEFGAGRRSSNVGPEYSNQTAEREDYALTLMQSGVELFMPAGMAEFNDDPLDSMYFPMLFAQQMARLASIRFKLANTDTILELPLCHMPSAVGPGQPLVDDAGATVTMPGSNGMPIITNSWHWPESVEIPAKGQFKGIMRIGQPLRDLFQLFPNSPGNSVIPITGSEPPANATTPNWYVIRVWHRGHRAVQLRGARSS